MCARGASAQKPCDTGHSGHPKPDYTSISSCRYSCGYFSSPSRSGGLPQLRASLFAHVLQPHTGSAPGL
jgi:hypothetical protein